MHKRAVFVLLSLAIVASCSSCSGKRASTPTKSNTESAQETAKPAVETAKKEEKGPEQAPDHYSVELQTTKGPIVIDVYRKWAPKGADRFYELVTGGYYTDVAFFRVISGFMAQLGIHGDPKINGDWREKRISDDSVVGSNSRGTLSFATSGRDTRTTQFFINFGNNSRLDSMGFAPFGKVRTMDIVDKLYAGYGEGAPSGRGPSQALMATRGNAYLRAQFPQLDYVKKAVIVDSAPSP